MRVGVLLVGLGVAPSRQNYKLPILSDQNKKLPKLFIFQAALLVTYFFMYVFFLRSYLYNPISISSIGALVWLER